MQGNDLADNVTQALVASGSRRVYVVSRLGELGIVPEDDAGLLILLNAELLSPEMSYLSAVSYILAWTTMLLATS